MEQNPFPEKRKKRKEGRQAPEPQPEPRGTSKSWWNRTPFLRKERREKKGDKHRNPSRNQEGPANHDGTEPLTWGKKEERRTRTSERRTSENVPPPSDGGGLSAGPIHWCLRHWKTELCSEFADFLLSESQMPQMPTQMFLGLQVITSTVQITVFFESSEFWESWQGRSAFKRSTTFQANLPGTG